MRTRHTLKEEDTFFLKLRIGKGQNLCRVFISVSPLQCFLLTSCLGCHQSPSNEDKSPQWGHIRKNKKSEEGSNFFSNSTK